MVAVTTHRKMLILSVCFLWLPSASFGMFQEKEQYLIDGPIQPHNPSNNTSDFTKKRLAERQRQLAVPSAAHPTKPREKKSSLSKSLNNLPAVSHQQAVPARKTELSANKKNYEIPRGYSSLRTPTSIPTARSSWFSMDSPLFDSNAKKLNKILLEKWEEIKSCMEKEKKRNDLSAIERLALEFVIEYDEPHTIRLIPTKRGLLDLGLILPKELVIFVDNEGLLCVQTANTECELEIQKSNKRTPGALEAEPYDRFVKILENIPEETTNYFPFFNRGIWKDEDLLDNQLRHAWDLEKLFTCLTDMHYSLHRKSTTELPRVTEDSTIKDVSPEDLLDKFFKMTVFSIISDKNNWNEIDKDTFERIFNAARFLKSIYKPGQIFKFNEARTYIKVLDEVLNICSHALCTKETDKLIYYYYHAKNFTLGKSFKEAWNCIHKCIDDLQNLFDEAGTDLDEIEWLTNLKDGCYKDRSPDLNVLLVSEHEGDAYLKFGDFVKTVNELYHKMSKRKQQIDFEASNIYLKGIKKYYVDRESNSQLAELIFDKIKAWNSNIIFAVAGKAFRHSTREKDEKNAKQSLKISGDFLDYLSEEKKEINFDVLEVVKEVIVAENEVEALELKKLRVPILKNMIKMIGDIKEQDEANQSPLPELYDKLANLYYDLELAEKEFCAKDMYAQWDAKAVGDLIQFLTKSPYTPRQRKMIRELCTVLNDPQYQATAYPSALDYFKKNQKWVAARELAELLTLEDQMQEIEGPYKTVEEYKRSLWQNLKRMVEFLQEKKTIFSAHKKNWIEDCALVTKDQLESLQGRIDTLSQVFSEENERDTSQHLEKDEYIQKLYERLGLYVHSETIHPEHFNIVNIEISNINDAMQGLIYSLAKDMTFDKLENHFKSFGYTLDQIQAVVETQGILKTATSEGS